MSKTTRRKFLLGILVLVGCGLFLWRREDSIVREGELFEIRAQGRVFDYANGQPIPDAWVMLGLHTSNPTFAGDGGGCSEGSAVVKTDANGEFSYRATIRKAGSGPSGFWTFVYHPDYAGKLRWQPPPIPGVSTFPIDHEPDGVPLSIGMARQHIGEWEALKSIEKYAQQACLVPTIFDSGHAEFSRMRYQRTLTLFCGPKGRAGADSLIDVMDHLEARLNEQTVYAMPRGPERNWPTHDVEIARRSYVGMQVLPTYPWMSDRQEARLQRELTSSEKAAFCSFYSLPIENLINKDFLP